MKKMALTIILIVAAFALSGCSKKLECTMKEDGETATVKVSYNGDTPSRIEISEGSYNKVIMVKNGEAYNEDGTEADVTDDDGTQKLMKSDSAAAKSFLIKEGFTCK